MIASHEGDELIWELAEELSEEVLESRESEMTVKLLTDLPGDALEQALLQCSTSALGCAARSCRVINSACAPNLLKRKVCAEAELLEQLGLTASGIHQCSAINLQRSSLTDHDALLLVPLIAESCSSFSLRFLSLRENDLGCGTIRLLTVAAERGALASVERLNLSCNPLGDTAGELFGGEAKFVKLRYLNLEFTHAEDRGVQVISSSLSRNLHALESLELQNNRISDVGATALAEALPAGNLRRLSIHNNVLTFEAKEIIQVRCDCHSITAII